MKKLLRLLLQYLIENMLLILEKYIQLMSFIEKVKSTLSDPKQLTILATGIGFLAFYALYARKKIFSEQIKKSKTSSLDMSLQSLIKAEKKPNIIKIAIIESSPASIDFKRMIVTKLKQFLISQQLNTLVNCAPLKLFQAGSQVFIKTLSAEDPEDEQQYMSLFKNALKCQLIIERTIQDINEIKKKQEKTYIICDTNSLDLRTGYDRRLWNKFLAKENINESDLKNSYDYVFHIQSPEANIPSDLLQKCFDKTIEHDEDIDQKIVEAWGDYRNFHLLKFKPYLMMEENVENAIQEIITTIRSSLPKNTFYEKKRVFTKHW